jgi:hypothetical protein
LKSYHPRCDGASASFSLSPLNLTQLYEAIEVEKDERRCGSRLTEACSLKPSVDVTAAIEEAEFVA